MVAVPDWDLVYAVSVGTVPWAHLSDRDLAGMAVCNVEDAVHQTAINNILEARAWLALKYIEGMEAC